MFFTKKKSRVFGLIIPTLLILVAVCFLPLFSHAQPDPVLEKSIQQIRTDYYAIRTKELTQTGSTADQVMYFIEGQLVRIDVYDDADEAVYEYYYTRERDVFFAYAVASDGGENRYYFATGQDGLLNLNISVLIRWLDKEKQSIPPTEDKFEKKGFEILAKSIAAQKRALEFKENNVSRSAQLVTKLELIEQKAADIDQAEKEIISFTDLLADMGEEDREFCREDISGYSLTGEKNIIYKVYRESCDPGCMVYGENKQHEYYTDQGDRLLLINEDITKAYSATPTLYNHANITLNRSEYVFFENNEEIAREERLIINGYRVY